MKITETIKILGENYTIETRKQGDDPRLEGASGYVDTSTKRIVIADIKPDAQSKDDLDLVVRNVLRHEIVHAYLYEGGLDASSWATNEEIVDWIALQLPKMAKTMEEAIESEEAKNRSLVMEVKKNATD